MINEVRKNRENDTIKVPLDFKTKFLVEHNIYLKETSVDFLPVEIDQEITIAYLLKRINQLNYSKSEKKDAENIKIN